MRRRVPDTNKDGSNVGSRVEKGLRIKTDVTVHVSLKERGTRLVQGLQVMSK